MIETIKRVYIDALLKRHKLSLNFGKTAIIVNRSFFKRAERKQIHILIPTDKPEKRGIVADKYLARLQRLSKYPPRCKSFGCGININYGYEHCGDHINPCCCCKKKDANIFIYGRSYCHDCLWRSK